MLQRVINEIMHRSDVVGIAPNDGVVIRLVGAFMIEANDEWTLTRRYMALETLTRMGNTKNIRLPAIAVA
jgi:putative transposase